MRDEDALKFHIASVNGNKVLCTYTLAQVKFRNQDGDGNVELLSRATKGGASGGEIP